MTDGGRTAADGTPVAVDVSGDRPTRIGWVMFLGGPVLWFAHFMLVYLVAEAGCTGDGPGLETFDPPVPKAVTLAATAVAAMGCLWLAAWAYRRWVGIRDAEAAGHHEERHHGALAFSSMLLSLFSFVAVLFVGAPALFFEC